MVVTIRFWIAASLFQLAPAVLAADIVPEHWTPSSEWVVDYAESECRLIREFSNRDHTLRLLITKDLSFDRYTVILAGQAIPRKSKTLDVTIKFDGDAEIVQYPGTSGPQVGKSEHILQWFGLPAATLTSGPKNQLMRIDAPIGFAANLELRNVKAAMESLNNCQDDLLRYWKIDPNTYRNMQQQLEPIGNPGNWATFADYPSNALDRRQEGVVTFLLRVAANGKPLDCSILKSSGVAELDKKTCQIMMQRAKFKAAMDREGKPVEAPFVSRVKWGLPN